MPKFLLGGILLLAFLLRTISLSSYPVGFTPDEASFAYDAYSLLKTGKDQWGHSWPLVLESFGDFKSPLLSYLAMPFVATLGLTKTAIRLPNALLGTLAVLVTYFLALELGRYLWPRSKSITNHYSGAKLNSSNLAIVASLLLAISPWHVMMSRGGFEANLTTFFLPLGILLFLKALQNHHLLYWAAGVFGLNLFTYHSPKLVVPLLLAALVFIFRKDLKKLPFSKLVGAGLVFGVFLVLTAYTFSAGAGARASGVSIFQGALEASSEPRLEVIERGFPALGRVLHNKYQVSIDRFLTNYATYFSPQFFFSEGPKETTYGMIPGRGVLYWFEALFILGFLYYLFKTKEKRALLVILVWLLLVPIPAALSTGPGHHANRAVIMLPSLQIALSIGALASWEWLKKNYGSLSKYLASGFVVFAVVIFVSFLEDYFIQSPRKAAVGMLKGNLEAAQWLVTNREGEPVIMSTRLSEPHIYVAFANAWDPKNYQEATREWNYKERGLGWVDQIPEYRLGDYVFKQLDWRKDGGAILVGKPEEFLENQTALEAFNYPDGSSALLIVDATK